jgi:hypothetical protein
MVLSAIAHEPEKDSLYAHIRDFRAQCRDGRFYAAHLSGNPRQFEQHTLGA